MTLKRERRLSERRLQYLFEAVESESMRGAADKLNIEPSVISRQIQILERELDTVLLDRHGRGVKATESARLVLEYYRRHISEEATMLKQLEELKGLERGNIHLAASEGFIEELVEVVLNDFNQRHPNIKITLDSMPVSKIVKLVSEQRIKIGLAFAPHPNNNVNVFRRKRHPLYVICRRDHPIVSQGVVPHMQALVDYPFALVPEEFGIGQLTKLAEHSSQISLTRAMETNSLQALRQFVTSGLGLTILPKILVAQEIKAGLVKAVKVKNVSLQAAEAQIITPKGTTNSNAEDAMLHSLTTLKWFA